MQFRGKRGEKERKMKIRISATIDEETEKKLDSLLKNRKYRNKSHIIEEAINQFVEKEGGKK